MSEAVDKAFDKCSGQKPENPEEMRATDQRLAGLEQEARQLCLATGADVPTDTEIRKRTEGAAAAKRVISGDNSSVKVGTDPTCLTSFGDDSTGLPTLSCWRYDALVDNSAGAPKPCLSPVEMRTRTAAGGLLPAGTASTVTIIIFHQSPLWFCLTKEIKSTR